MTDTELETPSGKGAVMVRVDDVQGGEQETSSERVAQLWIQYSGELIPEGNYRLSLLWKASPEMPVALDVITVEKPYEMGIKSRNTEIPSEWTTEVWEFNVQQGFSENKIRLPLLSFGNAPEGATFWIAELKVETVDAAATSTKPTLK
jgi:hypothetical protein